MKLLCERSIEAVREVGNYIRNERKKFSAENIEIKSHNDFVSYVDKTAEEKLVTALIPLLPGCGFITEEDSSRKKGEIYNWIIDPLDGTTNFIHGLPCYCISVGLIRNNQLVMGIVYELNFDEMFYAWEGSSAFLNGNQIHSSQPALLKDALLATGFPTWNYDRMDAFMEVFVYCMKNTHGLRRLGSAASDLVYVACGRLDGFFEYALNPWDVAGGAFILKQAGGKVTDFSGGDKYLFGKEILATAPTIHEEFLGVIKNSFNNQ